MDEFKGHVRELTFLTIEIDALELDLDLKRRKLFGLSRQALQVVEYQTWLKRF